MRTPARRARPSGEQIQTVAEHSGRDKFQGEKRVTKDRGPRHCTQRKKGKKGNMDGHQKKAGSVSP